jgi:hypothetical protein
MTCTSPPPEQTRWKKQQSTNQREYRVKRDADKPQRDRQKPDNGKENQRKQCHWPAQHEQNAPSNKHNQSFHIPILSFLCRMSTAA